MSLLDKILKNLCDSVPCSCTKKQSGAKNNADGTSIIKYILRLAKDKRTEFAELIDNFVSRTKESKEVNPQVVLNNIKQFIESMKDYLIANGGKKFNITVHQEKENLSRGQYLDLDEIMGVALMTLVVTPLGFHLRKLLVVNKVQNGELQQFSENLKYLRDKTPQFFGVRTKIVPPNEKAVEIIISYLTQMQQVISPLEKLDELLAAVNSIYEEISFANHSTPESVICADDFLPLLTWIVARSGLVDIEIESEYICGLTNLKNGEGEYYLTSLATSVEIIKSWQESEETTTTGNLSEKSQQSTL